MKTTKCTLILAALLLCPALNSRLVAQERAKVGPQTSPDTLVANLYKQHKKLSPFFQTRSRALLDIYFARTLADLIWKDAIDSKGEVGLLDGDPLYNAQDMEIKNFSIHKPTFGKGKAEVIVSFENFGQKTEITFLLEPRRTSWKVANIKYQEGADLVGILRGNYESPPQHGEIKVYLVAVGDRGRTGRKFGCDDSLVAVARLIRTPNALLRNALEELLSIAPVYAENSALQNFWKGRNLKLRSVSVRQQIATIHISGEIFVAGICDEPRIKSQISATARQFPNVKKVKVLIGGRPLAEAIR